MKKVLIVFFIFAYVNCYFSCTSKQQNIIRIDYDNFDKSNTDENIIVMSKDSMEYHFQANKYRFLNDSIEGFINKTGKSQRVALAKSDIIYITKDKDSSDRYTIELIVAIGLVVLVVWAIIHNYEPPKGSDFVRVK